MSLLIGESMTDGYRLKEIAAELGQSQSWVSDRLNELRSEILLDTGLFLPLTDSEFESLRDSIAEFGVRTPVMVGEHQLIDGRHRWQIAQELGLAEIPAVFLFGLSEDQEHDISVAVNTQRRHLTSKQKRIVIRSELKRQWDRSSRQIAAVCGVSSPTVEAVREEMRREAAETGPELKPLTLVKPFTPPPKEDDVRTDSSGRLQPAYVPQRQPGGTAPERQTVPSETRQGLLGFAVCSHGQLHEVRREGDDIRLAPCRD